MISRSKGFRGLCVVLSRGLTAIRTTEILTHQSMKPTILPVIAGLSLALTSFAAQAADQFGEITTLENFGGPSSGTYKPTAEEAQRIATWIDVSSSLAEVKEAQHRIARCRVIDPEND